MDSIPARRIEIGEAAELAAWDAVHRVRRYGVYPSAVGVSRISSAIQLAIDEAKATEAGNG